MKQWGSEDETIAADWIQTVPWPGSNRSVRALRIDGKLWCIAADVCRALKWPLGSSGRPNLAAALGRIDPQNRCFRRLEITRGSPMPCCRYALTTIIGVYTLLEEQRRNFGVTATTDEDFYAWVGQAVSQTPRDNDPLDERTTTPLAQVLNLT